MMVEATHYAELLASLVVIGALAALWIHRFGPLFRPHGKNHAPHDPGRHRDNSAGLPSQEDAS